MLNLSPIGCAISLFAALLCFFAQLVHSANEINHGDYPYPRLKIISALSAVWASGVFCLILLLQLDGLTLSGDGMPILRWSVLLSAILSVFTAFRCHEWTLFLSGLPFFLTVPFFETAFGNIFPWILCVMLLCSALDGAVRSLRAFRTLQNLPGPDSPIHALESLDAGILFMDADGKILLQNSIMEGLSRSICKQKLRNGNDFWNFLELFESTELVTKVAHEGSYLFRFAGGYTWSLFREKTELEGRELTQIIALNVSESERIRKTILSRKTEAEKLKESAQEVLDLADKVDAAKAKKEEKSKELRALLEAADSSLKILSSNPGKEELTKILS